MKCKEVQELMGAYLYGDLSAEEMRGVRLHVQDCPTCRRDLESRGAVLAAVPNEAPSLADEERMQLTWAVKGAIRSAELAGESSRWGYAFAAGLVLAMGAAVAGIVAYNSSKPQVSTNNYASRKPPAVVVKIREHRSRTQSQPAESRAAAQAQAPAVGTTVPEQPRVTSQEIVPDVARQLANFATTARRTKPQRKVAVEPPAVVDESQTGDAPSPNGEPTLPEPVAPNDARTVSE